MEANNLKNKMIQQYRKIVWIAHQNRKLDSITSTLNGKESQLKEAKLRLVDVEEKQNDSNLLEMKLAMDIATYENIRNRLVPGEEFIVAKIERESKLLKIEQELKLIKSQIYSETFKDVENQVVENEKHITKINDITKMLNTRKTFIKHQLMAMLLLFVAMVCMLSVYH